MVSSRWRRARGQRIRVVIRLRGQSLHHEVDSTSSMSCSRSLNPGGRMPSSIVVQEKMSRPGDNCLTSATGSISLCELCQGWVDERDSVVAADRLRREEMQMRVLVIEQPATVDRKGGGKRARACLSLLRGQPSCQGQRIAALLHREAR